ncbi:MAG: hypothetical protein M1828_005965 [Chrysothrix sp. TS-e1954]|nr:MAG: hypothetical protein M1828_005965 [Chrysothrix sp. TS-e1954]
MTNISPLCNELLGGHNAVQIAPSTFSLERINGFLQEAYSINARISELLSYLHTVKPSYLSTAPPPRRNAPRKPKDTQYLSNNQRDAIDAEAKSTLRDLNATINNLSQAESVRQQSETALQRKRRRKGGFGALGQWASGGGEADRTPAEKAEDARQNGVNTCRDGVVWYLQRHLESCSKVQSQMMEIRISGEIEKSRNALNLAKGATPSLDDSMLERDRRAEQTPSVPIDELDPSSAGGEQHLSQEQMQMFQQENRDMLKLYSDRLDQVRQVTEQARLSHYR